MGYCLPHGSQQQLESKMRGMMKAILLIRIYIFSASFNIWKSFIWGLLFNWSMYIAYIFIFIRVPSPKSAEILARKSTNCHDLSLCNGFWFCFVLFWSLFGVLVFCYEFWMFSCSVPFGLIVKFSIVRVLTFSHTTCISLVIRTPVVNNDIIH